ncbi:MAG: DUF5711 family protein [Lachnospiraceae bacterium]|nr:DUF5711 family protein [Lachnospiraceae bacterium]
MYIRTVLLVVLAAALVFLFIHIRSHWRYRSYKVIEAEEVYDSVSEYVAMNGKVLRYSPDGARLTDAEMKEEVWEESFSLTQPVAETMGDAVVLYDKRGTEIHVYNMEERLGVFATTSPILFARAAGNGNVAVAVEDGEGTEIVYYNSQGEEIAAISPSAQKYGYPLSMAVSLDGTMLAVAYVAADGGVIGSRLTFYNFGAAGQDKEDHVVAMEEFKGKLIPELRFSGKSELLVFFDDGFTTYKGKTNPKRRETVKFDEEIVSVFCDESRIAFVFRCNEVGHRYRMDVYKHNGKQVEAEYVDIIYDKGHFSDGEIIFCNNNEMAIYTHNGHVRFSGSLDEGMISNVIKTGKNRYFVVTDSEAEIIKLR